MKCKFDHTRLIDYLFHELPEKERQEFESHLENCPDCQSELRELEQTASVLKKSPDISPAGKLIVLPTMKSASQKRQFGLEAAWIKWLVRGIAAAAVLVLLVARAEVHIGNGQVSLTIGKKTAVPTGLPASTNPEILSSLKLLQEQNLTFMKQLVAESENRQKELLLTGLRQLSRQIEEQRLSDLMFVGENLQRIQQVNLYNFDRTNSILKDLTQAVAVNYPNRERQ